MASAASAALIPSSLRTRPQNIATLTSGFLDIPRPTMAENKTWPWTAWNVQYLRKQVEKDLTRLATTIANLEHVSRTVEARAAAKAASKPAPAVVAAAQPEGGQPTVAQ